VEGGDRGPKMEGGDEKEQKRFESSLRVGGWGIVRGKVGLGFGGGDGGQGGLSGGSGG
jgi:hypothetical protein